MSYYYPPPNSAPYQPFSFQQTIFSQHHPSQTVSGSNPLPFHPPYPHSPPLTPHQYSRIQSMSGYPSQHNQQPPYGAPPQQYGQQPPYGAPPHGAPPQQFAQQPPFGAPPQQYGQQAPYGAPPQQYGQPPYGAPPQQYGQPQYGAQYSGPPAPPSIGYDPAQTSHYDVTPIVEAIHKSMKGFGTDEKGLIAALARVPDPLVMARVRQTYGQRFMKDMLKAVSSEVSGYFGETCEALVRGPLEQDAHVLHDSLVGPGTKEVALDDVLLGRSNADLRAIKAEYNRVYRRSLEADVKADLSMKTETLFVMVLSATRQEESAPVIPQQIEADATEIHRATVGVKLGADAVTVCQIFSSRSNGQLRAISHAYEQKYRTPLAKIIEKEFSGHMEKALLRMLYVAEDPAMADAQALEDSMKGIGTKDRLLLNRLVRIHWKGKDAMQQVKGAYKHRFKKELVARVKGETSGDFERVLVAVLG